MEFVAAIVYLHKSCILQNLQKKVNFPPLRKYSKTFFSKSLLTHCDGFQEDILPYLAIILLFSLPLSPSLYLSSSSLKLFPSSSIPTLSLLLDLLILLKTVCMTLSVPTWRSCSSQPWLLCRKVTHPRDSYLVAHHTPCSSEDLL